MGRGGQGCGGKPRSELSSAAIFLAATLSFQTVAALLAGQTRRPRASV